MANVNEEPQRVPWLPVYDDSTGREPIAPSKPVVPARSPVASQPVPVVIEDPGADIIAPVTLPPPEEIMPTDGHAAWEAVPVFSVPSNAPATPAMDPIQSLGDAAVRRASLSASGATTPLGGVAPSVPSAHSIAVPSNELPAVSPYQTAPTPDTPIEDPPAHAASAPAVVEPALPAAVTEDLPWLRTPDAASPHAESPDDGAVTQATTDQATTDLVAGQENLAPASAVLRTTTAPGFMAATPPTNVQPPPPNSTPASDASPRNFTPVLGTPVVPDTDGGDANDGEEPPMNDKRTPWWRSWPFLVVIGLLVMGGIAYAVITALSDSEPVELTPEVIVTEPEEPTHEPIAIENPTAFQEALPPIVGLYALTAFDAPEVSTLELSERVAEANMLTYQYEDITLSVRAIQHFDAETALRHFDTIAADGTDRGPVSAGSADVGERVNLTAEDSETIVWRNSTALFFVTGPADAVEEFFTQFPL